MHQFGFVQRARTRFFEQVDTSVASYGEQPSRERGTRSVVAGQIGKRCEKGFLRDVLRFLPISKHPHSKPKDRLPMPIDKQAKVVRPSGKHALHKFSVLDFQLFDPRTWAFLLPRIYTAQRPESSIHFLMAGYKYCIRSSFCHRRSRLSAVCRRLVPFSPQNRTNVGFIYFWCKISRWQPSKR